MTKVGEEVDPPEYVTEAKAMPARTEKTPKGCTEKAFCKSLNRVMNDEPNSRAKGFSLLQMIKMSTGKMSWPAVVYKMNAKDRGVCLNFCPFCGADLQPFLKPHLKPGAYDPVERYEPKKVSRRAS